MATSHIVTALQMAEETDSSSAPSTAALFSMSHDDLRELVMALIGMISAGIPSDLRKHMLASAMDIAEESVDVTLRVPDRQESSRAALSLVDLALDFRGIDLLDAAMAMDRMTLLQATATLAVLVSQSETSVEIARRMAGLEPH